MTVASTLAPVNSESIHDPASLVNQGRYPVEATTTADRERLALVIAHARRDLHNGGVAILPEFLTSAAVDQLVAEANSLTHRGHFSEVSGTPYLNLPDPHVGPGDPRAHFGRTALTAIPYDVFSAGGPTRSIYEWDALKSFLESVLEVEHLYRYADPLGALNVAVMHDGDELAWHFDQTDFVVSIALQSSTSGGDFVHAPGIRQPGDERYADVAAVLGDPAHPAIQQVPMVSGTLMLFQGRYSLHRVTPITGAVPRLVALLAYDTKPDTNSTDLLKLVRYGRVA